ncbi:MULTISPECIES: magnesium transporter CorA family protein [Rhizobium]|uniref:magnesium transporter CorA family protein n=1 Tax=Rhizobium sp. RU35A TaxID=1907414 RepID=UPI001FCEBA1E|nr:MULTISPECIES: magnesium transporter CorA family protein [Rhizobium]
MLTAVQPVGSLSEDIVWIDLFEPTREEDSYVEQLLDISVPTRDELKDIEPSSRLYTEKNGLFMTGSVVWKADSEEPELTDVAFILAGGRLLTVRYAEPRSFRLFTAALGRTAQAHHTGASLLAHLIETIVDRTAEILEGAVTRVDRLSIDIFRDREKRRPPKFLEGKLADIAGCHRLVGKVRDSLGSLSRVLSFLMNAPAIAAESELHSLCGTVARDVATLSEHAAFVAGNIAFLLDASLGLINVEQNAIIKIFSIASVVFLPPTLVASVYGMNFRMMPELDWTFGYPWALLAMLVSALVPFYFFRWKGWL